MIVDGSRIYDVVFRHFGVQVPPIMFLSIYMTITSPRVE